jgi:outer membrane protein TolC
MHRICAILSVGLVVVLVPGRAAGVPAAASGYVAEALANNLGLAGQALDVEQARSRLAEVRGALQPRLDLMARYSRADGGRTIDFPTGDLLNGAYRTLNDFLRTQGQAAAFPQIANQSIPLLREREQETKLRLT